MNTTYSHSRMQSAATCMRQYELRYVEGLEKKQSVEHKSRIFGSAIHAAFEYALLNLFNNDAEFMSIEVVQGAKIAALEYIKEHTDMNAMRYDWETGENKPDLEYYQMINDMRDDVRAMVDYYLPRMELGTRFEPVSRGEVLGVLEQPYTETNGAAAIEWEFNEVIDGHTFTGRVDAVLWDNVNCEYVLFDWKTRAAMPFDTFALLDGQLHLYAAMLNRMGANITRVCMAQMKKKLPSKTELSTKDGMPLTGRASYDTTWEAWVSSAPANIDTTKYKPLLEGKLKTHQPDFYNPVFGLVTPVSCETALKNAVSMVKHIEATSATGNFPAALNYETCSRCEFFRMCAGAFRYGGNVDEIVARDFNRKEGYAEVLKDE